MGLCYNFILSKCCNFIMLENVIIVLLLSITKRSSKLVLDMEIKFIVPIHEYKGHCVVCTDKANMMDVYTVRNMIVIKV